METLYFEIFVESTMTEFKKIKEDSEKTKKKIVEKVENWGRAVDSV